MNRCGGYYHLIELRHSFLIDLYHTFWDLKCLATKVTYVFALVPHIKSTCVKSGDFWLSYGITGYLPIVNTIMVSNCCLIWRYVLKYRRTTLLLQWPNELRVILNCANEGREFGIVENVQQTGTFSSLIRNSMIIVWIKQIRYMLVKFHTWQPMTGTRNLLYILFISIRSNVNSYYHRNTIRGNYLFFILKLIHAITLYLWGKNKISQTGFTKTITLENKTLHVSDSITWSGGRILSIMRILYW